MEHSGKHRVNNNLKTLFLFNSMTNPNKGTAGTKEISKRYPVEEGLIAKTTKQTNVPYLEEQKSELV